MSTAKRYEYLVGFAAASLPLPPLTPAKARLADVEASLNKLDQDGWWILQVTYDTARDGFIYIAKRELHR
jgi:hypothetical protein